MYMCTESACKSWENLKTYISVYCLVSPTSHRCMLSITKSSPKHFTLYLKLLRGVIWMVIHAKCLKGTHGNTRHCSFMHIWRIDIIHMTFLYLVTLGVPPNTSQKPYWAKALWSASRELLVTHQTLLLFTHHARCGDHITSKCLVTPRVPPNTSHKALKKVPCEVLAGNSWGHQT